MTPRQARTCGQVCSLPRDNVETEEHWITIDGPLLTIAAQRSGEDVTEAIHLPRATFEAFIDWYNTGKFKMPRKRKERGAQP